MAEGGETLSPPREANSEVKPPAEDSDQRRGISAAFQAAVGRVWRSWMRGPEGMVDVMSKAPRQLSPFSKQPPSDNPKKGLDESNKP